MPLGEFAGKLLPFQRAAAEQGAAILQSRGALLDASDTGVGKTYVSLAICAALGLVPHVVTLKSTLTSWERAAAHFGRPVAILNYEKARLGHGGWFEKRPGPFPGTRLGDTHHFAVHLPPGSALIFDELQNCTGRGTLNAAMLLAARWQGIPTLGLSATAAESPLQMRAIGYWLGLHGLRDYWAWAQRYGVRVGGVFGTSWDREESAPQMLRLHAQIFPARGIRLRKKDLGDAFPENLVLPTLFDIEKAKINGVYKRLERELAAVEENREQDRQKDRQRKEMFEAQHAAWEALPEAERDLAEEPEFHSSSAAVATARAQQEIELLKVPAFLEQARAHVAEGNSVVLFVNFRGTIAALQERAEGFGVIQGMQSREERDRAIDDFQGGRQALLVSTIAAGGVGISLHDTIGNFPRVTLISPPNSARHLVQALGRCVRAGAKSKVVQKIVYAAGTVEETRCLALQQKLTCLDALNDGDMSAGLRLVQEKALAAA